jgi:hypothetical protein
MSWFSDALFGKRQRIDPNKMNDYMQPFNEILNQFKTMGEDMMDPMSQASQQYFNRMQSNAQTQGGVNMQNIQKLASMGNMNPASALANIRGGNQELLGGVQDRFSSFMQNRENTGISLLDKYMRGQQSEGERQSNMHIQQVNAHNAARQANMQMGTDLLGMGLNFGANFIPEQTSN